MESPRAELVYRAEYRPPANPYLEPDRFQRIVEYLLGGYYVRPAQIHAPTKVSAHDLLRVHDAAYLESLDREATLRRALGIDDDAIDVLGIIGHQRFMTGGTVMAARLALSHRRTPVVNLGGGFHHARRGRAGGFCLFNDIAVAIESVRAQGFRGRVLVVDFDFHPGDGTRSIYADDPDVFTLSLHARDWDKLTAVADLHIPLGTSIGDRDYLAAVRRYLPEAIEACRPELVFYVAGTDVAYDDRLGSWRVTEDGIFERDRLVAEMVGKKPFVWLLAGGYGRGAWRHTTRSLAWLTGGSRRAIPDDVERELRRYRRVAEGLSMEVLSNRSSDSIEIDLDDVLGGLGVQKPSRYLDFYTKYGIEVALAHYGVTERMRALGYPKIAVDFEFDDDRRHLMRVVSDDRRRDLLMELLVHPSREYGGGHHLLFIDWLLLQNPRRSPSDERPLLPTQRHPGLGILPKVIGMLLMSCERLGYDGLVFVPAHYHMAVIGRRLSMFIDPVRQAYFQALMGLLSGMSLSKASSLVDRGAVVEVLDDGSQRTFRWEPSAMVIAGSEPLRAQLSSNEYDSAVSDAEPRLRLVRVPG